MERLTLEEAIKHAKEVAKINRAEVTYNFPNLKEYYDNCAQRANQYDKLAEWLEELKSYKDIDTPKNLKELKENGAFTGLELTKLAIMQKELKEYKDLEEQGLLVRLPCKVGEKLWCIVNSAIRELRVHHFDMPAFGTTDIVFRYADGFKLERFVGEIGKTVFLTREEAEKKLDEVKNEI